MTRNHQEYASAAAFRMALESRLNSKAKTANTDVQRLRRQVAFDRFLSRLFVDGSAPWLLKGGYAMELRLQVARTTRDIDLSISSMSVFRDHEETNETVILQFLQRAAGQNLEDFFSFTVGEPTMKLDAAVYGGARYPVDCRMDGRTFAKFHVDVGLGDEALEPKEMVSGEDWLAFAGVPAVAFASISREQQFAEKYHAYTLPRGRRQNSRVRDLVDLVLLIQESKLDAERLREAVSATFRRRKTHQIPDQVPAPPDDWAGPFLAMAQDCGILGDIHAAAKTLTQFIDACNWPRN